MAKFSNFMLAASMSAAAFAVPAAASEDVRPRAEVRYGDLDLSQAAGRAQLTSRIQRAARKICGARFERDLQRRAASQACRAEAMRSVEVQLASVLGGHRAQLAEREGKRLSAR